jgi:hypothetical protein
MYKKIKPIEFTKVDDLINDYKNNQLHHAIQLYNTPDNIHHSKIITLPFDWHRKQVNILKNQPEGGRKFTTQHRGRQLYVSYMKNATLISSVIVSSEQELNNDTYYHHFGRPIRNEDFNSSPNRTITEPVFYLGETTEYYHWIMDCLSALYLWKKLGFENKVRLFIANTTNFKIQTLKSYGIEDDMIISHVGWAISSAHQILISPNVGKKRLPTLLKFAFPARVLACQLVQAKV